MAEVTVRVPQALKERLEALSVATDRPESFLAGEAIAHYVESEEDFIESLKQSNRDIENGLGVPHDEAVRRIRAHIACYPSKRL